MRLAIALSIVAWIGSVSYADDWTNQKISNDVHEMAQEQKRQDFMENFVNDAPTRTEVINEAGDGCHWAAVVDDAYHSVWKKTEDGYHREFLKVCDDDPK